MSEHTFRQGRCVHCGITWFDLWECDRKDEDVSRLRDLVAQAAAVAPRQAAKIEERARRIIDRESDLEAQQDEAFGNHESILHDASASMDDLKHALAPLTNNPPLPVSDASPPAPLQPGSDGAPEPGR